MLAVTVIVGRSTTETVPVIAAPTTGSATISVPAELIGSLPPKRPATLIADGGSHAVGVDHDAVGRVANADRHTLRRRVRGQVDLGERIVLVEQGVSGSWHTWSATPARQE